MFGTYNLTRSKNDAGYFTFLHNDMYIGQAIKNGKLWEPHIEFVLKNILDSNKSSINIGTHIGSHSVTMAKGSKKFYGFEPQPIIHWLMRLNLFDNGLNNFETFNNAVGNKRGMITLSKELPKEKLEQVSNQLERLKKLSKNFYRDAQIKALERILEANKICSKSKKVDLIDAIDEIQLEPISS